MAGTLRVETFSISHAQVLDGATAFKDALSLTTAYDIYGVEEGTLDPQMSSYENKGDNRVMSSWDWLEYAQVMIQNGWISFPLLETLTGQTVATSGSGATLKEEIDLWHEDAFNVPPVPMLLRLPSRTSAGVLRTLDIGLYKVELEPIKFNGPRYKDGLKVQMSGKALMSEEDELGATFGDAKTRVGKLISWGTTP